LEAVCGSPGDAALVVCGWLCTSDRAAFAQARQIHRHHRPASPGHRRRVEGKGNPCRSITSPSPAHEGGFVGRLYAAGALLCSSRSGRRLHGLPPKRECGD
jgi:hypothetical protein